MFFNLVADFRTQNCQRIAALQTRWAELRRTLKWKQEQELIISAGDPDAVARVRASIKQAEAEIAQIDKQIVTIREWKVPAHEKLIAVRDLEYAHSSEGSAASFHQGEALRADYQERPKAAAEARKRQAEAQAEREKTRIQLRKAIEKLGLDPTPICGAAA